MLLGLLLSSLLLQQPVPDPKWGEDPHAPRGYQYFGGGFANLGDLDGDGLDDIALSDPEGSVPATIWIISGRKGWVIESLCSDDSSRWFGSSMSALPDVDGDGTGEILVGLAPDRDETTPGRVAIYSGRTRVLLRTIDAPAGVRRFGSRVAGLKDVDGDGAGDVLVTADLHGTDSFGFVYSGQTGRLRFRIQTPFGVLPRSIDPVGDVDADGIADIAFVGLITKAQSPLLRLVSGSDGHLIGELDTGITSVGNGLSTLPIEDIDRDGLPDLLFCSRGVLQARSATDLRLLRSLDTPDLRSTDSFRGVTRVGDIDGDGEPDIVIGNPDASLSGGFDALSARSGKVLWKLTPPCTWRNAELCESGQNVLAIGDCDRDGVRDFMWAPGVWGGGPGLVFVSSGKTGSLLRAFARGPRLSLICTGPKG